MQITINTDYLSRRELDILRGLVASYDSGEYEAPLGVGPAQSNEPSAPEVANVLAAADKPTPVKVTKPKREAAPVAVIEPTAETPVASATPNATPPTIVEVREALQAYTAKNGMEMGIKLLRDYDAARVSDIDADEYANFIARCAE